MKLDSLSGVLGEFWLQTDKTNIVPGILTIELASSTRRLLVNGYLSELFFSSSDDNEPTVIHGRIGGTLVSFIGCFCTKQTLSSVRTQEYHVPIIVSGAHITDESKRIIRRVYLRLDNMHSWVPPIPIEHSFQSKGGKGWKLDLSATSEPIIERSNTYFGSIEVYKSDTFHSEQHRFDIASESTIILRYSKGASILDVIEHCGSIRNLSAMMTGTLCNVTLLEMIVSLPFTHKNHKIDLYSNWVEDSVIKKPSEFEVVTYTELGGVDAMAKCLNDCHQSQHNAAVLNRLGLFWFSKRPYNEYKFISMTVALEHLFLWLNNVKKLKGDDEKLSNQLYNIILPITEEVGLFIPDMEWIGRKAARYRGWAAHANLDIPPDRLLFFLMGSLYLCIMLRYTHDLGADMEAVCDKIYSRHQWFREWDKQLNEAMEKHPL